MLERIEGSTIITSEVTNPECASKQPELKNDNDGYDITDCTSDLV